MTLFPGIEYLSQTTREGLDFAAKGNGFPFRDIAQFVFPGSVSQWSPLFVGLPALFFVAVALVGRAPESRFWLLVALVALLHSLGENSAYYYASYNLIPGLRFFRGQERAAVLVAISFAVLAALGITAVAAWSNHAHQKRALDFWLRFSAIMVIIAFGLFLAWSADHSTWQDLFEIAARSALVATATYGVLRLFLREPRRLSRQVALVAVIAFELFSTNIDHPANYDSIPFSEQLSLTPPAIVQAVLEDDEGLPFRVDGFRGLRENYGSLYGLMDMRGISPLWLNGPKILVYADYTDNPLAWELFAVKYVFSGKERLSAPSRVIAVGDDPLGTVWLHRLADPRPFARLYYEADVVNTDKWALELMDDIRYHEREKIVIHQPPKLDLPGAATSGSVAVTAFAPEEIILAIDAPANAILSLSLPHYPGWEAHLNGKPSEIIRAYAGLSAVAIPAGQHELALVFAPPTYAIGAFFSLATWLGLALFAILKIWRG